ncbi:MAG: hypothetical protein QOG43_1372 [Actinomycetota bacterium]|jgi:hypothetical protein|nr:hypothetical protein [Actinomycetota bacterium]
MTVIASIPRNPEATQVSGSYTPGIMNHPGGTLTINDVTPWPGRSTGESVSNKANQDSIARQYGSSRTGNGPVASN